MNTLVALLRGINVGGKNKLPMRELSRLMAQVGCTDIRTYIQSGNAVFENPTEDLDDLASRLRVKINQQNGFAPDVQIFPTTILEKSIRLNPFPQAESDPKSLHLSYLASHPESPNLQGLEAVKTSTERFRLIDRVFYLHAPDGIGRSKLAAGLERLLGVSATSRNWRTVIKLSELAGTPGIPKALNKQ